MPHTPANPATALKQPAAMARANSLADTTFKDVKDVLEAKDAQESQHVAQRPCYVLDPRSTSMGRWDALTSVALIFTAVMTPIEVGFLPAPKSAAELLFIINRAVDLIFIFDIYVSFFLMYRLQTVGRQAKVEANAVWEWRPQKMAARYLRGWFTLDICSVAPSIFDFSFLLEPTGAVACVGTGGTNPFKVVRMVRILRLFKIVRLLKASRVLARMERRNTLPYAYISFVSTIFQVLLVTHWFACILVLAGSFSDPLISWKASKGYCVRSGAGPARSSAAPAPKLACAAEGARGLQALLSGSCAKARVRC